MTYILLTGAGFTRNWGGWLADEVFEYLLADPDITPSIRTQLWRDRSAGGNYENTIQAFRDRSRSGDDADFKTLIAMLGGMFNLMKGAFRRQGFAFDHTNDRSYQISQFLYRFHWIFTLNQDTLLERHYFAEGFSLACQNRWNGYVIPGLELQAAGGSFGSPVDASAIRVAKTSGFALEKGPYQPYIKLHGSHNWMASRTSGLLLITGGNKETDITESPLLAWYSQLFREAICSKHARIMVIGYSFGDRHINRTLIAATEAGAKLFIIDPAGVNAFDKRDSENHIALSLRDKLWPHVIGASRRPLHSTFGSDHVEHSKVMNFFNE